MNCQVAHERILAASYGELADDLAPELERHLAECDACRDEQEALAEFQLLASQLPLADPDPNLVARARMRLDEALDALPPRSFASRLRDALTRSFFGLAAAPVAASVLLLVGLSAGSFAGYRFALNRFAATAPLEQATILPGAQALQPEAAAAGVTVANVSSVVRQPGTGKIEVHYNQVVPQKLSGSIDDPAIRQLLMLASSDEASAGVHDDSVGLIAAECRAGRNCSQAGIRDALLVALRYDKNSAVREKALHGLEPYVSQDTRVRNAVLEALLNDADARIRTSAINLLEPVEADTSVRQVLSTVANSDRNPHIRLASQQILSRVPEIQ